VIREQPLNISPLFSAHIFWNSNSAKKSFYRIPFIYTTKLTAGLSAGLSALGWYSNYRAW